jgi:large subunit ribosomal protein L23
MSNINMYDVIRRPIVTEKSAILNESNKYVFEVDVNATKPIIKEAVEKIFKVAVLKVNVMNVPGKTKRFKGTIGRTSDRKKAIVTLANNNVIDFMLGVK